MNTYRTQFFARCPSNGIRIAYTLTIKAESMIPVERILDAVEAIGEGYHEAIADRLQAALGGTQFIAADHHGVTIETRRSDRDLYLDQTAGGMAGTPGY